MTTVKKDEKVEAALKAAYKTKKYGVTGTFGSAGLVRSSAQSCRLCWFESTRSDLSRGSNPSPPLHAGRVWCRGHLHYFPHYQLGTSLCRQQLPSVSTTLHLALM